MTNAVYLNRSLSYVDINPQYDDAENKCYLLFQLYADKHLTIESDALKSIKISRISIVSLICTLKLRSSNNYEEKEIIMKLPTIIDPVQSNISLASNLTFYKEIKSLELENLLEWRKGGDVILRWSFHGKGLADVNGRTILLELLDDPNSSSVHPHISQNKWDSMVMKCKLDDKFIIEHPLSIPDSLRQKTSPFLNQILPDLTSMVTNLNSAKDRIRKANNTSDYKAVMGDVKSSLDSIKNLQVNTLNANQLFVKSKTFVDRDMGGGGKAAFEVLGRVQSIMKHIYEISSKPAHTELKKEGLKFEMNPDNEDALFVFESSLALFRYFIEKLKKLD